MSNLLGWIGLVLLLIGWTLPLTHFKKYFFSVVAVASIILTIHAIILKDIPFIIVNGFVSIVSCINMYRAHHHLKKKKKR